MKDLLRVADLDPADMQTLLELSATFKATPYKYPGLLRNDTVVLYFAKPSTRTRISFETAVARLGGTPICVGHDELQLGRGETIEDTARTISRYARAFVIRTYADDDVGRFAAAASIPTINALTEKHHPMQALADMLTLRERLGGFHGRRLAFVGDGNNVAHSLLEAGALAGLAVAVATPPGYEPDPEIVDTARALAARTGGAVLVTNDPAEAVQGAHAVYTDVWLSMGTPESERERRMADFVPYRVNEALMEQAAEAAIFMHCLPDHRGEEVTAAVIDGPRAVIFQQVENRLHTAKAVLFALLEGELIGARRRPREA